MNTRHGMLFAAVATALILAFSASAGRVVILGFDGADPGIVRTMMEAGELPNLAKLQAGGSFQELGSSSPPQSPTAWSSFSTCKTPHNHGIYDFLRRDPKTYLPAPGFGRLHHAELDASGNLARPARYESNRQGDSFWKVASDQGLKVKALLVPFAYPADDLSDECRMLCGLDTPDIRGTQSTYFALSTAFPAEESVPGGLRLPLKLEGDRATVQIPGIRNPRTNDYVEVPLEVAVDAAAKSVSLAVQGESVTLKEGEWSGWVEWEFALSPSYSVRAISRYFATEVGETVRIYMTCLQFHPEAPYAPISTPGSYAADLVERVGLYKTIGWAYDTKALERDDMTEAMFLEDARRTMAWREQLVLDEIDAGNFDLLVGAWTATDRVAHMFWAHRDPKHPLYTEEGNRKYGRAVEDTYLKMDSIVGNVMARLNDDDLLMVMSDHGFHSFRKGFSVNTWLVRNGYLTVTGQPDASTAFTDTKYFFDRDTRGYTYDWSRSRAYGLGLGMIFLNRQGRERNGIVTDAQAGPLLKELQEKLLAVVDPDTGEQVFRAVYTHADPQGVAITDAPDIQLGYAEGYQTDKASAAGAAPVDLFSVNDSKWSGEHASSDHEFTSGILFSNAKLKPGATLLDLGVTALDTLGAKVPADFEGKPLR
ncbi:MAG: alkaline phosphatase family protein [Candidatus Hydrogenedentes bacterium]|nr:alkaline phosphatase family protein [Candidatus Hydrogenedentota bacterium]